MEFLASAFRTTATDPANPGALVNTIKTMGMPLYYALPPTGYYITADKWMNSSALVDRLNFAYALTGNKFANQKFDSAHVLALGLMAQTAPSASAQQSAPRTSQAKYAEAESLLKSALEQKERQSGKDHPNLIDFLHDLSELKRRTGEIAEAESAQDRADRILATIA